MLTKADLACLKKLAKIERHIDQSIEALNLEFEIHDRKVEPILHALVTAQTACINLKHSIERSGK